MPYSYDCDANRFHGCLFEEQDANPADADRNLVWLLRKRQPFGSQWRPVELEHSPTTQEDGEEGDFPTLYDYSKIPLFSERAWKLLAPLLEKSVEALPATCNGRRLYLINVLDEVDCLDEERSQYSRSAIDGRINTVYKHVLRADRMTDSDLYRLPLKSGSDTVVSDRLREAIEANRLRGLSFGHAYQVAD